MYICLYIEICGGIRWRMMGYTETVWNMLEHNTMDNITPTISRYGCV